MKLLFIRHADPDYQNDTITDTGHTQAAYLADALIQEHIDEIISSSYGRAMDTAQYTAERLNLNIESADWLREVNGNYNPGNSGTLAYHGADLFAKGLHLNPENWHELVPYGAHTLKHSKQIIEGFTAFMEDRGYVQEGLRFRVTEKAERKTAALFCHAGSILTLLAGILHIPIPITYAQFAIDPASVTRLEFEEKEKYGVFRMECMNNTSHLNSSKTEVQQTEWEA